MAGDWIKMRRELQSHPKVVRILSATSSDKFRAIGGLHAVWGVFDSHSKDGTLPGYTPDLMDHIIGWQGFSAALLAVGWLHWDGAETLSLPEFDEHNSQSAKRRAEDQKRKRNGRAAPEIESEKCGQIADKLRTREEKRREEVNQSTPLSDSQANTDPVPLEISETLKDKPVDLTQSAKRVLEFLNLRTGHNYRPVKSNIAMIVARLKEGYTEQELRTVTMRKVNEWGTDEKMADYLRPKTLYNATNFNSYAGILT